MKRTSTIFILLAFILISLQAKAAKTALEIPQPIVYANEAEMHYYFKFDDGLLGSHTHDVIENDNRTRNFTMSVWVNSLGADGNIFGHTDDNEFRTPGSFAVSVKDGKLGITNSFLNDNNEIVQQTDGYSDVPLVKNEWTFITLIINDTEKKMKLFKNGTEIFEKTIEGKGIGLITPASVLYCGNFGFYGYIDEIHLWNKVLSNSEVRASMKGKFDVIPEELIAYYDFTNYDSGSLNFPNKGNGSETNGYPYYGRIYNKQSTNFYQSGIRSTIKFSESRPELSYYILTYDGISAEGTFTVKDGPEIIPSGSEIFSGTLLSVEVSPNPGFEMTFIQVNEDVLEGNTFTMEGPSVVTVNFRDVMGTAIRIPAAENTTRYQFRFDDELLGSHTNGSAENDTRERNITMSAWIKPLSQSGHIFGHMQSGYYGLAQGSFSAILNNGKLSLRSRYLTIDGKNENDINKTSTTTLTTEEWAFISIVVNNNDKKVQLYKDGQLVLDEPMKDAGNGIGLLYEESVFYVGNNSFTGDVDEVQVWNKVLTQEEITASMGGYSSAPQELIYLYKFTDMASDFTFSNSGSGGECYAALYSGTIANIFEYTNRTITAPQFVMGHITENYTLTYEENTTGGTFGVYRDQVKLDSGTDVPRSTLLTVKTNPDTGYQLKQILVNGQAINGNTFRIIENSTVTVQFTDKLLATYSLNEGGSIIMKENGTTLLENNGEFTYGSAIELEFIPLEGYEIRRFTVNDQDRKDEIANNKFTLGNCIVNTNFEVEFAKKTFAINFNTAEFGSVTIKNGSAVVYNGSKVDYGSNITITLIPVKDAEVETFTINSVNKMSELKNNTLTVTIVEALDIQATFSIPVYTITYNNPSNGTIKVELNDTELQSGASVNKNSYILATFTPNENCNLESVKLNNNDITSLLYENTYWIEVSSNVVIEAVFKKEGTGLNTMEEAFIFYDDKNKSLCVPGLKEREGFSIYNTQGICILKNISSDIVNLSFLPEGCYIVVLKETGSQKVARFIKR